VGGWERFKVERKNTALAIFCPAVYERCSVWGRGGRARVLGIEVP
jgi:hypothetical protein